MKEAYNATMLIGERGFRAFTEYDLEAYLNHFLNQIREEIQSDISVTTADDEEYVRQKVTEKTLSGIEFDASNITVTQREEQIPARFFPNSIMIDEGRSYPRMVVTFHLPFTGDVQLLQCQPSTRLMVSDEIDIEDGSVIFDVINFNNDAEQAAKARDEMVNNLTQQAGYVNKDIAAYNSRIEGVVREAVRSARAKFKDQSDFMGKLGNKPKNG